MIAEQSDRSRLLMPGIDWLKTPGDNRSRRARARDCICRCAVRPTALGSDTSFVQVLAEAKQIWSLRNDSRFLVRGQAGHDLERRDHGAAPRPCVTSRAATTACAVTSSTSSGPWMTAAKSSAARRWSRRASNTSIRCARAGRSHSSSIRVTRSKAMISTRETGAGIGGRWLSPLGPIRIDLASSVGRSGRRRLSRAHHAGPGPMRWVLRSLLAVAALCALALVGVVAALWVLGSEQGTAWIVERALARTNGAITIGRIEGTLLGRMRARRRCDPALARRHRHSNARALLGDGRDACGRDRARRTCAPAPSRIGVCRRAVRRAAGRTVSICRS